MRSEGARWQAHCVKVTSRTWREIYSVLNIELTIYLLVVSVMIRRNMKNGILHTCVTSEADRYRLIH